MNKKILLGLAVMAVGVLGYALTGCHGHGKIEVSSEPVASTLKQDRPYLKVFIENSGSMDGYMCDGSQLKDAIYDYVSDLNRYTQATGLNYINSTIIPYQGKLTSYIKDLNPAAFSQAGGNRSNTDLGSIIADVLKEVNDSTVVMFVSDCILDLPSSNAQKFLTNCEIRIKDEVIDAQKRIPDLGVEIMKLSSDFTGRYFGPDGKVEMLTDVKRPYYIWIIGDKNYLAKLNTEVPLSMLSKYGLEGVAAFSNQSSVPYEVSNRGLTGKIVNPRHGDFEVTMRVDFRSTLQPDVILQNVGNYRFNNSSIKVDGISVIKDSKSPYTHVINFTIPDGTRLAEDCLTLMAPAMPTWVEASNDENGTNISANLDKTIGIMYLVQGVADAYKNEDVYAKMSFKVKNK